MPAVIHARIIKCNYLVLREQLGNIQIMDTKTKALSAPEPHSTFIHYSSANSCLGTDASETSNTQSGYEGKATMVNSSIICEDIYEELDLETEDTQITIIISDASTAYESSDASLSAQNSQATLNSVSSDDALCFRKSLVSSDDALCFRKSLEQCLKLASCKETDICCFLCSETFTSFVDIKKHFSQTHNLIQNTAQLSNLSSEYITQVAKEINKFECNCTAFVCAACKTTFPLLLQLMQHVLLSHPTSYGNFKFFTEQQQGNVKKCLRCTLLNKLCHVDYDLFVRVLLECTECLEESCKELLLSWPLADYSEPCEWCAEEGESEMRRSGHKDGTQSANSARREVVCYRIKQTLMNKHSENAKASRCICPLLKCPDCPKTVANFADLCKHVRLNSHSSWHDLRILWEKYKIIKENCLICPKHSYHIYILCPHCPHQAFESEKAIQAHMDSEHNAQTGNKVTLVCTCPNHFVCLKCSISYPTPQSLHHHMQQMQHETEENLAAIPTMIQSSIDARKQCLRCSQLDCDNAPDLESMEVQEECSCRWVECSTCKISFRKVSSLLDHIRKAKHTMSATDIRKEREKLASSVKTCQKCCREADKYCMLCHRRENFIQAHIRSCHQDQQIMLLRNNTGTLLEEYHLGSWSERQLARYECSVCRLRFPHINKLWHHVSQRHPRCYFTLLCLDLSDDVLQVKDFTAHEELMVLNIVSK